MGNIYRISGLFFVVIFGAMLNKYFGASELATALGAVIGGGAYLIITKSV